MPPSSDARPGNEPPRGAVAPVDAAAGKDVARAATLDGCGGAAASRLRGGRPKAPPPKRAPALRTSGLLRSFCLISAAGVLSRGLPVPPATLLPAVYHCSRMFRDSTMHRSKNDQIVGNFACCSDVYRLPNLTGATACCAVCWVTVRHPPLRDSVQNRRCKRTILCGVLAQLRLPAHLGTQSRRRGHRPGEHWVRR